MRLTNNTRNTIIADNAKIADTVISRLVGLLNRSEILPGEALVITQCRSIHMFFMKFGIDVIFVNRKNIVVGLVKRIQPFQMSPYFIWASRAIELPEGVIEKTQTSLGDRILFEGVQS